jgi:hypothetical protein
VGEEGYNKDEDMKEDKKTVEDTISIKVSAWLEDLRNSFIVKRVSWFKSSLLLRINNKHTYKY